MLPNKSKFIFFWGGMCSQWAPSPFILEGSEFNCAEQWMMLKKAMLFDNFKTADMIMSTASPQQQKKLGRQVKGYDDEAWMEVAYDIVVEGNIAKFSQNPEFKEYLKGTGDKIIVEASPYDKRWGIGMSADAPGIEDPNNWKGINLLGKAIMEARKQIFET